MSGIGARRRAVVMSSGAVSALLLLVVSLFPPAALANRNVYPGATGTFTGPTRVRLWAGTVPQGATVTVEVGGALVGSSGTGPWWLYWKCDGAEVSRDGGNQRFIAITTWMSQTGTLASVGYLRDCGYYFEITTADTYRIDRSVFTMEWEPAPIVPDPSGGPTASPSPTPTPAYSTPPPSPTPTPVASPCWQSMPPDQYGPPAPIPCVSASPEPTASPVPGSDTCDIWKPWKVRDPGSGVLVDFYRLELCGFTASYPGGTSSYGTSALIRTYTGIPFGGAETGITVYERYGDYRDTVTTTGGGASLRWYVVGGPTAISTPGSTWEKPGSATTSYYRTSARSAWTGSQGELRLGCLTTGCTVTGFSSEGYEGGGGVLYVGPSLGMSALPWNVENYDPAPTPSPGPTSSPGIADDVTCIQFPDASVVCYTGDGTLVDPQGSPVPGASGGTGGTGSGSGSGGGGTGSGSGGGGGEGYGAPGDGTGFGFGWTYGLGTPILGCVPVYPKTGMASYWYVPAVAFPGLTLDVGAYAQFGASVVASWTSFVVNSVFFVWNRLVDFVMPSQCLGVLLDGEMDQITGNPPFSWPGQIKGDLVAGLGASAGTVDIPTLEVAGVTVDPESYFYEALGAVQPYRPLLAAFVYLLGAYKAFGIIARTFGTAFPKVEGGDD